MNTGKIPQLAILLGAAVVGSACILQNAAPAGTPQVIVVTATPDGAAANSTPESQSATTPEWTQTLAATFTPSLTATFTETPVTLTAGQDLSCVTGPDWKLYEWVTKVAKGETVALVARAVPEIPDYYVARTGDGRECWVFGASSTISGSTAELPVRETPPLPTVSFVVQNRVYINLISVYIRPAGSSAWGANRLSAAILPGGETAIPITAGYYDVLVRDVFGGVMLEAYNRAIGADDTYRILQVAVDVEFTIQNGNPFSLCKVDVMHTGGSWEKLYNSTDGGGPILTGQQRSVTLRAGLYQLRRTTCSSTVMPASPFYLSAAGGVVLI